MDKQVNIIACIGPNNELGNNGDLCYHIKGDMMRFRTMTTFKSVIMGRKTWDSLPEKNRPLPYRENIVITRNPDFKPEDGVKVCSSLIEAIETAEHEHVWIIGGAQIYKLAMQSGLVDSLFMTHVNIGATCDTFFPKINENEWKLASQSGIITDEKNPDLKYQFAIWNKKVNEDFLKYKEEPLPELATEPF